MRTHYGKNISQSLFRNRENPQRPICRSEWLLFYGLVRSLSALTGAKFDFQPIFPLLFHLLYQSVFVVEIPLMADCLAEAEGENDAQDLDGDHAYRDADDNVQMVDENVVHSIVATLKMQIFGGNSSKFCISQ